VVYLDEAGVDHRLTRVYGRALRGQQIFATVPGKRGKRINMIGGWFKKQFIAPLTFEGGCDQIVFNTWLETSLLPELPEGTTVVMDNAAFHKTPETKALIEAVGCHLLYLPPYSPDLNPIEHCWHTIKSWLRPRITPESDLQSLLGEAIRQTFAPSQ
jgi:transposase